MGLENKDWRKVEEERLKSNKENLIQRPQTLATRDARNDEMQKRGEEQMTGLLNTLKEKYGADDVLDVGMVYEKDLAFKKLLRASSEKKVLGVWNGKVLIAAPGSTTEELEEQYKNGPNAEDGE